MRTESLNMSLIERLKQVSLFNLFGSEEQKHIGVYGPPNSGKTTLSNRISSDFSDREIGSESSVPHETRKVNNEEVEIQRNGTTVSFKIIDTPGIATSVDYEEFLDHGIDEEKAIERSREATEGITEALRWLKEDVDGVIYVLDSTENPFVQVNTMVTGLIESENIPILIFANKTDLEDSKVERIQNAFPQHPVVPLSAKHGYNMEEVYEKIVAKFG